ncbi:hypothetical protein, partial [Escherichia coli]|uniref:hypothetical protein n=1 Tax=Escherichia coli TaxID=562 RepID=UPI001953C854
LQMSSIALAMGSGKREETFFNFFLEKLFIISNFDTALFDVELDDEEQVESLIKSQVLRDLE